MRFRRLMGLTVASAALASAALSPAAMAADPGELARCLREERFDDAAKFVADEEERTGLVGDDTALRDAARAAAERSYRPAPPAELMRVTDALVAASGAAVAARPESPHASWALGHSIATQERLAAAAKARKCAAEVFVRAADLLAKAKPGSDGDEALRDGVILLGDAVGRVASQQELLGQKAVAFLEAATKDASAEVRTSWAVFGRERAEALVPVDRRVARVIARAAFDQLRPVCPPEKAQEAPATAWNDLVTFDRIHRFGMTERYRTERVECFGGRYSVDVPVGPRFTTSGGLGEDQLRIVRTRPDGGDGGSFVCQGFDFRYAYDTELRMRVVGGDNPQKLASATVKRLARTAYKVIPDIEEPKKDRIGVAIAAWVWALDGEAKTGGALRIRGWTIRGENQTTWELLHMGTAGETRMDPESQSVLDSLREQK